MTAQRPARNLIISGGASHGATLWGAVLVALDRFSIYAYAGASIGAVIAAGLALGLAREVLEAELVALFQHNRLMGGAKPLRAHPRVLWSRGGGLHDWSHAKAALRRIFGDKRMSDVKNPLKIVIGDVYTGRPVYISSEEHPNVLIWEALLASTAIAPIADAQEIPSLGYGNRLFVDGGWGDNVPVSAWANSEYASVVVFLAHQTQQGDPAVTKREGFTGVLAGCLELALYANPDLVCRDDDLALPITPHGSGLDFDLPVREIRRRVLDGAAQAFKRLYPHD